MSAYLVRRIGYFFLTMFILSLFIFGVIALLPGDVCATVLGRGAPQQACEALKEELGLKMPFLERYGNWLGNFLRGDWGTSYGLRQEIFPIIFQRLGNSLRLALIALLLSVPPAICLGVIAGLNENRTPDVLFNVVSLVFVGIPEFVMGIILINVVALQWKLLPSSANVSPDASFVDALPRLILPALTAAAVLIAYIGRLTRVGVLDEVKKPYVRTAILKGLSRAQVVIRHILPNALLPTITVVAISTGWLISGLVVIENVFAYPGLGQVLVRAIERRDLPLIQAGVLISAAIYGIVNLIADLLYALLNPRIRYG
ncbi:MAG: ABC transporter permease [Anaerolineae bacterium]